MVQLMGNQTIRPNGWTITDGWESTRKPTLLRPKWKRYEVGCSFPWFFVCEKFTIFNSPSEWWAAAHLLWTDCPVPGWRLLPQWTAPAITSLPRLRWICRLPVSGVINERDEPTWIRLTNNSIATTTTTTLTTRRHQHQRNVPSGGRLYAVLKS